MNMNLFAKATEFEKLCNFLVKKAQQVEPNKPFRWNTPIPAASLSGPAPHFSAPTRSEALDPGGLNLNDFAAFLSNFDAAKMPGTSLDVNAVKQAGDALAKAVASKNNASIMQSLKNILSLVRDGGGKLYENAQKLLAKLQPSKPNSPAWLDQYMSGQKKMPWLDQYMAGEKAQDMMDNMHSSLESGPAEPVKETLQRSNKLPNFPQG